ncbi:hypothetical protein Q9S78_04225 [Microbacterium sp. KSW-18]|uniref:Multidrug transporter n=1 Tax=Microbacterium aquilitoris TaxID=3067307 RepID=A0ABU3GHG3_9MICO|nr:hypothetical protein [Microbacterium sp. KSW-18]MDT3329869.1 hypothetical protein [Microbacterium sp. KSW-18]
MTEHEAAPESDSSLPGGNLPDEDPIEAVSKAARNDEPVPIEQIEPGVDPDSADSSRSLNRTGD